MVVIVTGSEQDTYRKFYEQMYLHGDCYYFALALHSVLGWEMFAVLEANGESFHAFVRSPQGQPYDVRGMVSEEELTKPFRIPGPYQIVPTTKDILREAMRHVGRELHEVGIRMAVEAAQFLLPDLPWPEETFNTRLHRFAESLEQLSRQHGLWIRGAFPGQPPVISTTIGEEAGYTVSVVNRECATIDRRFT